MAEIIPMLFVAGAWAIAIWALNFQADDSLVQRLTAAPADFGLRAPDRRTKRKRFCVLHNPSAGRNGITLAESAVQELRKRDADVKLIELTDDLPPASEMAENYDAVVVSGGDGSVRSVAAAYSVYLPVALIPNGTGNVLANELALPRRAEALAELFMLGPTRTVQGSSVSGEPFLLMFGAGFDGEVVRDVSREALRSYGKLAYAGPVIRALLRKPQLFDIDTDGSKSEASWIIVTNASRYGGRFQLTEKTSIFVPGLIAIISHATTRRQRLEELLRLFMGNLDRARTIDTRPVEQATVLTPGIPAQIDGEPIALCSYGVRQGGFETTIVAY